MIAIPISNIPPLPAIATVFSASLAMGGFCG
jgi:hypothetical protein